MACTQKRSDPCGSLSISRTPSTIPSALTARHVYASSSSSTTKFVGVATPTNFVVLEDDEAYTWRAVSADGIVLGVREIDNEPQGSLRFWVQAIRNKLRVLGGYA